MSKRRHLAVQLLIFLSDHTSTLFFLFYYFFFLMQTTTEAAKGLLVATKVLRDPCFTFVYILKIIIFLGSWCVIYLSTNRPLKLQTTLNYLSNGKS